MRQKFLKHGHKFLLFHYPMVFAERLIAVVEIRQKYPDNLDGSGNYLVEILQILGKGKDWKETEGEKITVESKDLKPLYIFNLQKLLAKLGIGGFYLYLLKNKNGRWSEPIIGSFKDPRRIDEIVVSGWESMGLSFWITRYHFFRPRGAKKHQ